jgi:hypothetical protein
LKAGFSFTLDDEKNRILIATVPAYLKPFEVERGKQPIISSSG